MFLSCDQVGFNEEYLDIKIENQWFVVSRDFIIFIGNFEIVYISFW